LSAVVKDGAFKPGRGSLAEVLPGSVKSRFASTGEPLRL
jgi:hypothetical protein